MSATNIAKADPSIANRYLAQQVNDTELNAIEGGLMEDPDFVKELEATARFKVGLQHLRDTGQLEELLHPLPARQRFAIAACFALALAGAIAFIRFDAPPPLLAPSVTSLMDQYSTPLPIASTHSVLRRRSVSYDAVIELPLQRRAIEIRVLPELDKQKARYEVSLALARPDGSSNTVATVKDLQPDTNGFVSVYADSSLLEPGDYTLAIVESMGAPQSAQVFAIKVSSK